MRIMSGTGQRPGLRQWGIWSTGISLDVRDGCFAVVFAFLLFCLRAFLPGFQFNHFCILVAHMLGYEEQGQSPCVSNSGTCAFLPNLI